MVSGTDTKRCDVKFWGRLGGDPGDDKEIVILGRIVRWCKFGIEYEAQTWVVTFHICRATKPQRGLTADDQMELYERPFKVLYILSIGDLSEKYMDFTFDMYFRQFWHDPRLSFEERPSLKKLVVGAEYIKGSFKKFFYQFSKILEFLSKKPLQSIRLFVKIFPSETFMLSWSLWKVGAAVGGQLLYLLVRLILNPFYEAAVIILRKK